MFNPLIAHRQPDPLTQPEFYSGVAFKRGVAWLFDTILIAGITLLLAVVTLGLGLFFLVPLFFIVSFLYRVITLTGRSATPGMRLMNVMLLTREGERFDFGHALLHTIGYTLSIGTMLIQLLSVVLMLTSARGQSLTDIVMGSVAINRPG